LVNLSPGVLAINDLRLLLEPATASLRTRVLLVEDHKDARECLTRLLDQLGYRVNAACDAQTAVDMSTSAEFDLLITDIGLPDHDGWKLLGMIRERLPQIQAIALSAYDMEQDLANSRAAGFLDHLVKPIRFQTLERAIQKADRLRLLAS
jgi:CheY-like chemotaxis protein